MYEYKYVYALTFCHLIQLLVAHDPVAAKRAIKMAWHIRKPITEKDYKCKYCSYNGKFTGTLKNGSKAKSENDLDLAKLNLKRHVQKNHRVILDRNCDHCSYSASNDFDLTYHVKTKHFEKNKAACKYCTFSAFPKFILCL